MSFIDGIFNFSIDICNVEQGIYDSAKVRISRHQAEGLQFFYARLLAYTHAYSEDLEFSSDATDSKKPHMYSIAPTGDYSTWIKIGEVTAKAVRHARKASKSARVRVYFFTVEQLHRFCLEMRGAKENWVSEVDFYFLPIKIIDWLATFEKARSKWQVTFTDEHEGYISIGDKTVNVEITELDMWKEYQEDLDRRAAAQ